MFRNRINIKASAAIITNPSVKIPSATTGLLNVFTGLRVCGGTGVGVFKLPAGRGVWVGGARVGVELGVKVSVGVLVNTPVTVGVKVSVKVGR